jgi:uncharacterized protein (DUF1330 family)
MRQYCGLGLVMLVGAAFGAAAVTGLHAQAKPPVYLVSEIEVANPTAYGAEFAPQAQAAIKAAGGRLIAIGGVAGAGAKPLVAVTGTPPKRVAIQQWDSFEQLHAWFNSPEYQAALRIGEKYATFRRYPLRAYNNQSAFRVGEAASMVTSVFCEQVATWPTTLAASRHCEATGQSGHNSSRRCF